MSSIALSGNASGAGVFTIASPNSASSYTATLPAATDTLATLTQANSYYGFKNRIINGAMVIDQRNAGASVSGTSAVYTLDRWTVQNNSGAARFNVQQNVNSVTPPAGYKYYLGVTSTSAYSIAATDVIGMNQFIEGYNISDLAWGTASAASVTLSFWVRSSLTGTFGGCLAEANAATAFYAFTYTISAANTWEQKTVTIAGPTIGTWNSTNARGIQVFFSLGTGSTYTGAAGSWTASNYYSATGATSLVGTNAATWYVTGVQLEKNSTATSFDYRPYGTELQLCQRYYAISYSQGVVAGTATRVGLVGAGLTGSTGGYAYASVNFPVTMRAAPTFSYWDGAGNASKTSYYTGVWNDNNAQLGSATLSTQSVGLLGTSGAQQILVQYTAAAEL